MQEKITDLETKFSFQEDLLQDLNQEVIRQQRQMELMVRKMRALEDQLAELMMRDSSPAEGSQIDEKPPHY